jgi:hypothetical protein
VRLPTDTQMLVFASALTDAQLERFVRIARYLNRLSQLGDPGATIGNHVTEDVAHRIWEATKLADQCARHRTARSS